MKWDDQNHKTNYLKDFMMNDN